MIDIYKKIVDFFCLKKSKNSDVVELLKSIDARLKSLENCVTSSSRGYGHRTYIVTGHWND